MFNPYDEIFDIMRKQCRSVLLLERATWPVVVIIELEYVICPLMRAVRFDTPPLNPEARC